MAQNHNGSESFVVRGGKGKKGWFGKNSTMMMQIVS